MSVINPRIKLVSFRLSEVEFEALERASVRTGARSLSGYARERVLKAAEQSEGLSGRLKEIDKQIIALEEKVEGLLQQAVELGLPKKVED